MPKVSIVIPTDDDDGTIERCLDSIQAQSVAPRETIVVGGSGNGGTRQICTKREGVTYIQRDTGRAEARRIGAAHCGGEFILHIDTDMVLSSSTVRDCVNAAGEGYTAAVIPERSVEETFWASCLDVEKRLFRETGRGYLRFIDANLYDSIGGHTSGLVSGEDEDLHRRAVSAGAKIAFVDAEIRHLEGDVGFVDVVRKKLFYARHHPHAVGPDAELDDRVRRNLDFLKVLPRIFFDEPVHTAGYLVIALVTLTAQVVHRR